MMYNEFIKVGEREWDWVEKGLGFLKTNLSKYFGINMLLGNL